MRFIKKCRKMTEVDSMYEELDRLFASDKYREAEAFLRSGIREAVREGDLTSVLALWNELGGFLRVCAKYKEGTEAFQNALETAFLLGLKGSEQEATIRMNLAALYTAAEENRKAAFEYDQAAEIYEALQIQDYRHAALQNNRASLYLKEKQYDRAMESAKAALAWISDLPDNEDELGVTNTLLAQIYTAKREFEKAEEHIVQAEAAFSKLACPNPMHYAVLLSAKGQTLSLSGQWQEARLCYEDSLPLIEDHFGKNLSYASCLRNLAVCCRELGDSKNGECYQKEAEKIEKEQGYERT